MLICPAVVMFLLGLQFGGNQHPWNSSVVIGLLVGGAATFGLFLVWEHHQGDNAMVPLAMVRHRVIWSAAMTMFFSLSSVLVADFYIAIYFQAIRDDSPLISGVHMLPITLGLVMFTMISGTMSKFLVVAILVTVESVLTDHRRYRTVSILGYYLPFLLVGGAISAIGYGLLSTLSLTTSVGKWVWYQILYGVGSGCTAAAVSSIFNTSRCLPLTQCFTQALHRCPKPRACGADSTRHGHYHSLAKHGGLHLFDRRKRNLQQ